VVTQMGPRSAMDLRELALRQFSPVTRAA